MATIAKEIAIWANCCHEESIYVRTVEKREHFCANCCRGETISVKTIFKENILVQTDVNESTSLQTVT
jgi:hypothetical protein